MPRRPATSRRPSCVSSTGWWSMTARRWRSRRGPGWRLATSPRRRGGSPPSPACAASSPWAARAPSPWTARSCGASASCRSSRWTRWAPAMPSSAPLPPQPMPGTTCRPRSTAPASPAVSPAWCPARSRACHPARRSRPGSPTWRRRSRPPPSGMATPGSSLPKGLTVADIAAFRRDGVVCLRGAFDESWIQALRRAVDRDIEAPGPLARLNTPAGGPGRFFVDFQLWQRWPECRDFAFDSPAVAIAAAMMGSNSVCYYHDHLLVKEPETAERTPWHHDQPYYPIDGEQICSIWLPLDPVGRETAVEYVKGSHRWGRWFAPRFFRPGAALAVEDPRFEPVPDIDSDRDAYELA